MCSSMGKNTVHPKLKPGPESDKLSVSSTSKTTITTNAFAGAPPKLSSVLQESSSLDLVKSDDQIPDQSPEHEPRPVSASYILEPGKLESDTVKIFSDISVPQIPNEENTYTNSRSEFTNSKKIKPIGTVNALLSATCLEIRQTNRDKEDFANVPNQYEVRDMEKPLMASKIFQGQEETISELRCRVTTSTNRSQPFTIVVYEVDTGDPVLKFERNGLNEEMTRVFKYVNKSKEEQVGVIIPDTGWNVVRPTFTVIDDKGNLEMKIIGPSFPLQFCYNSQSLISIFEVFQGSGKNLLAKITKDTDLYIVNDTEKIDLSNDATLTINFETNEVQLRHKVLIMAATFMLDYTYYSEPGFATKLRIMIARCCGCSE